MICLAHDRKLSLGDLDDRTISILAATMPEHHYLAMLAWEVFGRAVNEWIERRSRARIPSAKDWAKGTTS